MNNYFFPPKKYFNFIYFFCFVLLIASCEDVENIPDVSHVQVDISIRRLEKEIFSLKNKEDIKQYLEENPDLAARYFKKSNYPSQDILVDYIFQFIQYPYNDTLKMEVDSVFSNIDNIQEDFIQAFKFAKHYFPNFKIPKIYTCISAFGSYGFGGDLILTDDFIVIGLDYFIGKNATFHPKIPQYMLKRYEKEYIIPSLLMLISSRYNAYDKTDKSLLSEMIFYGKAYYFTSMLMLHAPDSLIAGYSSQEIADLEVNQSLIWGYFVEENLFYETKYIEKNKYLGERPKTYEISEICPGRVGRWLGWKIVQHYTYYHKNMTLSNIMNLQDANKIFHESKYKPPKF